MAGRDFGPPAQDGRSNKIHARYINELRTASIEDDERIDEVQAITNDLAERDLVEGSDPRIPATVMWGDDISYARIFADGKRSFLEFLRDGTPTDWSAHLIAEALNRIGYDTGTVPKPLNLVCDGDSHTAELSGNSTAGNSYPAVLADLLAPYALTIHNFGVGGQRLDVMQLDAATQIDPLIDPLAHNVLIAWGGANDIYQGVTAATVMTRMTTYCQARRAAGWTVLVVTQMPSTNLQSAKNTVRLDVNRQVRRTWRTFADGLIDVADDPWLGGDYTNTAFFSTDQVHLNDGGNALMGNLAYNAVMRLGLGLEPA